MSDPRSTDPPRRRNLRLASASAAESSMWTTVWTWAAAIAAAAVILGVAFGYSPHSPGLDPSGEPALAGSGSQPSAASHPPGDVPSPAPAVPDDGP